MYHLAECHTDPDSPPTEIPGQLVVDSWISAQEESWMGVDAEETARWRNDVSGAMDRAVKRYYFLS